MNSLSPRSWLVLTLTLSLLGSGCGQKPGAIATDEPEEATGLKVLASHRFEGSEEQGWVTALGHVDSQILVGTKKGIQFLKIAEEVEDDKTTVSLKDDAPMMDPVVKGHQALKFPITRIFKGQTNTFICSDDGYASYDGRNFSSESIGKITDMAQFEGTIWAGRTSGIERKVGQDWHKQKVGSIKLNQSRSNHVNRFAQDDRDRLWIGSEFGLYYYDKNEATKWGPHLYGDYQNLVHSEVINERGNCPLAGNVVNDMFFDAPNKRMFVATETGLSIFSLEEKNDWTTLQGDHEILSSEAGDGLHRVTRRGNLPLPSTDITSVATFGKWVFMGTSAGLVQVDMEAFKANPEDTDKSLKIYDTDHGLPSSPVTSLLILEDTRQLVVGTEAGVALMGPLKTGAAG